VGDPRACRIAQCRTTKNSKTQENRASALFWAAGVWFFRWFLEVVLFTISYTVCVKRAIRGLGVPFVGNDKNKASNSHHNPLSLSLLSLSLERGGKKKKKGHDTTNGGQKREKSLFSSHNTKNFLRT